MAGCTAPNCLLKAQWARPAVVGVRGMSSGSSSRWLRRQHADPFVRSAKENDWRSRAVYKLDFLRQASAGGLLRRGDAVVDLGAAPGSWSQYAVQRVAARTSSWWEAAPTDVGFAGRVAADKVDSEEVQQQQQQQRQQQQRRPRRKAVWELAGEMQPNTARPPPQATGEAAAPRLVASRRDGGVVVAVDVIELDPPLPGVHFCKGDFTRRDVRERVQSMLPGGYADVVLSDMAPSFTGNFSTDTLLQMNLAWEAFSFGRAVLRPRTGRLVVKVRFGGKERELLDAAKRHFDTAKFVKPPASRKESAEVFLLCAGYKALREECE